MKSIGLWLLPLLLFGFARQEDESYNPLRLPEKFSPRTHDLKVVDGERKREIPVLVYLPESKKPAPVVLFSHGLGGSRRGCRYLADHWAGRGYVAVFLQHPGSDESVWKEAPVRGRMAAMKKAASGENFLFRVKDVPAVLDRLEKWNKEEGHLLLGRLDLEHVGMSGHSFGARTTQAVSGETLFGKARYMDRRIRSAIAFSPSTPRGRDAKKVFGRVAIPWMLMTGTRDLSVIGNQTLESRLAVYPALPPGDKYELVLHDAEHSAFSDRRLPGDKVKRNPNHHRVILALSTAFWDATLRSDEKAKAWLKGEGPRKVMEEKDRWKRK